MTIRDAKRRYHDEALSLDELASSMGASPSAFANVHECAAEAAHEVADAIYRDGGPMDDVNEWRARAMRHDSLAMDAHEFAL